MLSGQNIKSHVETIQTNLERGDAFDGTYFPQITVRYYITEQNLEVKANGFVLFLKYIGLNFLKVLGF